MANDNLILKMKLRMNGDGTYSIIVTDEPGDKEILMEIAILEITNPT